MTILFIILVALVLYTYVGYYMLIFLISMWKTDKMIIHRDYSPRVTLIISAYNEENVIRKKIENSLNIDYPKESLEILVVSDASTDNTDNIVLEYRDKNVNLIRQEKRVGKTMGLNRAIQQAKSDIIVFTDANAMYDKKAVSKLVRHFVDPEIGYVTGESIYLEDSSTMARDTENTYWSYERKLKIYESRVGSMVGADGAIYAIRKQLYSPLAADDINDFVNPLMIIAKGFRGIYENEAVCYEDAAGDFMKEFKRKRRIVNRSWHGLMRVKTVLNPLKYKFFAVQVISHKLLRWLIPFILLFLLIENVYLSFSSPFYAFLLFLQCLFYLTAVIGFLQRKNKRLYYIFAMPMYFCLINLAAAFGVVDSIRGKVVVTWDTPRS